MAVNHVLVAGLDGPGATEAVDRAIAIAARTGARLTLLDLQASIPGHRRHFRRGDRTVDLQDTLVEGRREAAAALADRARGEGVDVEADVAVGRPIVETVRAVVDRGVDLVLRGAGGPGDGPGLDPATLQIVRKCPAAVRVVREGTHWPTRTIVVAVDPDPDDGARDELNHRLIDLAVEEAAATGAALHLLHVWDVPEESALRSSAFVHVKTSEVDEFVDAVYAEHKARIGRLLDDRPAGGPDIEVHLTKGKPSHAIGAIADRLDADLVVLGTVGRSGIRGLIMGNTAENVLRSVARSVLTLKPEGFESPLHPD